MRIGFIGLGVQGLPLALNMLSAGHELYGLDIDQEPLATVREAGGMVADTVRELAITCEVVFVCVAKDAQVIDVIAGENGLVANAAPGLIIVNHSTVSADTTSRLIEATQARGVRLVDAPVSGGARGAQEKTMSFMVGGDDDVLDICEPLFRLSGPTVLKTGPVGTATVGKLAHQVTIIGNILAMAEGMRLGVAGGLSPEIVKQIITGGLARSFIAETWGDIKMAPHAIPIYTKDLENSLQLAGQLGIELPGAKIMKQEIENIVP
jgi:2-hydroxy-3-oxopropionate reductase